MSSGADGVAERSELDFVIPVFDDWEAARLLLLQLDEVLAEHGRSASVFLVDDASSDSPEPGWPGAPLRGIARIDVVSLRFNVGHQRAIAVGLCHVAAQQRSTAVVVMDGDGEDRPQDVPVLLAEFERQRGSKIVFAERTRRSEGMAFTLGYHLYRLVHLLLTGIPVRVGNFSALPRASLTRLVYVPEMWSHYAAAVFRSGLAFTSVPTRRGSRLSGRSHMNWISLITHGLSALAVFGGILGVRLMLLALCFFALTALGLSALLLTTIWEGESPSYQVVLGAGLLLILVSQVALVSGGLALFVLGSRVNLNSFPARDYHNLVDAIRRVHPREG